jgi:hypothetical protein
VSTTEETLERKSSSSSLKNWEYSRRDLSNWPCGILYPQKLALTSLKTGGRLVDIVHSWTQATEFLFVVKKKAIPVTGLGCLQGCETLRIPHCLHNRLTGGGKVVSPTHQQHFTPKKHYYFYVSGAHFC